MSVLPTTSRQEGSWGSNGARGAAGTKWSVRSAGVMRKIAVWFGLVWFCDFGPCLVAPLRFLSLASRLNEHFLAPLNHTVCVCECVLVLVCVYALIKVGVCGA